MDSLPPLTSLLAFEAFYRTGSVTAAAQSLGRTHGAVSKQLNQLRDHAGVDLLVKHGSGLKLTAEGHAFAKTVAHALGDIRAGYAHLARYKGRHPVVVMASATFARTWLIPVLSRFNLAYPEIDVSLKLVSPDPGYQGEADLVFSYNRLLSPDLWHGSVSLGDVELGPVLSPKYPHRFENNVLSFQTRIDRRFNEAMWKAWSNHTGIEVEAQKEQVFDHSYLAFQAARSGMGCVMAPRFLVGGMFENGELIAPAGFVKYQGGLAVRPAWPANQEPNPDAVTLLNWLKDNASSET